MFYDLSLKTPMLQAWSSTGGTVEKWLGHKVANLINGLILLWFYSWLSIIKWCLVGGSSSLGMPLKDISCPHTWSELLFTLAAYFLPWGKAIVPPYILCPVVLPHPGVMERANQFWNCDPK
jgi:hypothetical protein